MIPKLTQIRFPALVTAFCIVSLTISSLAIAGTTPERKPTPAQEAVTESKDCDPATHILLSEYQAEFYEKVAEFMNSDQMVSAGLEGLEQEYFLSTSKVVALRPSKLESAKSIDTILKREASYKVCNDLLDRVIQEIDVVYQSAVQRTLSEKSSLMLVDKYDSINTNLRKLVDNLSSLTNQVKSFDNQLPCYIDRCLF